MNQSIENEDRSFVCQQCQRLGRASTSDFKSISSHTTNHETAEQLKLLEEMKTIHLRKLDAEQERQRKIVEQEEAFKLKRLEAEEQFINKKMELLAVSRGMHTAHTAQTTAGVNNEISHQKEVQNWITNQQKQVATLGMGLGMTNRIGLPIGDESKEEDSCSVRTMSTQHTSRSRHQLSQFSFPGDIPTPSKYVGNVPCHPTNPFRQPREPYQRFTGPSKEQIAARQVMKDGLPVFSGDPEQWPLFISNFTVTTSACGYTDVENMVRLQRSLKGPALEAVKSRLLIPSSVPSVIETLRKLFGRPEVVINSLLARIRSTPVPKADKLESIICFGMAVKNFCDHLVAAEQRAHLSNPCLLQELVDRLPANLKLDWACHKRNLQNVDLETFGNFMSVIVDAAADVTLFTESITGKFVGKGKEKFMQEKLNVHAVEAEKSEEGSEAYGGHDQPRDPRNQYKSKAMECFCCEVPNHRIADCEEFGKMTVENRLKLVQRKGLCRSCLSKHGRWPCKNWKGCEISGCRYKHHSLLHSLPNNMTNSTDTAAVDVGSAMVGLHIAMPTILFRIIPVRLYGKCGEIDTYAFLDDGSSSTLIEDELATQLGIDGKKEPLCLRWTGEVTRMESNSRRIQLTISGISSNRKYKLTDVRTVENPELPTQTLSYEQLASRFSHLRGLPMGSYQMAKPRILIGIDNLRVHSPLKRREGRSDEPVAVKTRIGWTIYGRTSAKSLEEESNTNCFHVCECTRNQDDEELHQMVKAQLNLENPWMTEQPLGEDEKRAMRILEQSTKRTVTGFETGLIWKHDHVEFPDCYEMAFNRLKCLEKRFEKDSQLAKKVELQIEDYEQKGYIHRATQEELESFDPRRIWFLPLGVVQHPKKAKIRLVWDAAAQVDGVSLNSQLLKGRDFLIPLPTVLLRFRQRKIAVSGDIREMFLQLKMCLKDKSSQLFLYRKDPSQPPEIYVIDVVTFGAACSPSTAQFIKIRNAEEFSSQYPRAVEAILKSHYVDDMLDSVDTEEEAIQLIEDVRAIHKAAGFEIRNFVSNSVEVMQTFQEDSKSHLTDVSMKLEGTTVEELVLGMLWRPQIDEFRNS